MPYAFLFVWLVFNDLFAKLNGNITYTHTVKQKNNKKPILFYYLGKRLLWHRMDGKCDGHSEGHKHITTGRVVLIDKPAQDFPFT